MRRFSSTRVGSWERLPTRDGSFHRARSTCTSATTTWLIGRGIGRTTRMTSALLVLIAGGTRPDRVLERRLAQRGGRYHVRVRRDRRCARRSMFSCPSRRWWSSALTSTSPLATQHSPVTLLPVALCPAPPAAPGLHPSRVTGWCRVSGQPPWHARRAAVCARWRDGRAAAVFRLGCDQRRADGGTPSTQEEDAPRDGCGRLCCPAH